MNDSDLCEPLRLVRRELKLHTGVICPNQKPSQELKRSSDFVRHVTPAILAFSQFPPELTDAVGTFHKPASW